MLFVQKIKEKKCKKSMFVLLKSTEHYPWGLRSRSCHFTFHTQCEVSYIENYRFKYRVYLISTPMGQILKFHNMFMSPQNPSIPPFVTSVLGTTQFLNSYPKISAMTKRIVYYSEIYLILFWQLNEFMHSILENEENVKLNRDEFFCINNSTIPKLIKMSK